MWACFLPCVTQFNVNILTLYPWISPPKLLSFCISLLVFPPDENLSHEEPTEAKDEEDSKSQDKGEDNATDTNEDEDKSNDDKDQDEEKGMYSAVCKVTRVCMNLCGMTVWS